MFFTRLSFLSSYYLNSITWSALQVNSFLFFLTLIIIILLRVHYKLRTIHTFHQIIAMQDTNNYKAD